MVDDELGPISREYAVYLPKGYQFQEPTPVMFLLHGWGGNWWKDLRKGETAKYDKLADKYGYIMVYPKGMADYGTRSSNNWSSWNVGSNGLSSTCINADSYCYDSCEAANKCGACAWTTCYDDVLFIDTILREVERKHCVETSKRFLTGISNGGMMVYHYASKRPKTFKGYMPIFGSPMLGTLGVPREVSSAWLLHFHGLEDTTVPIGGGASYDGWLYISADETIKIWAEMQECTMNTNPISTPWDSGKLGLSCIYYIGCKGKIFKCTYPGGHYEWPSGSEELGYWFFNRSSETEF